MRVNDDLGQDGESSRGEEKNLTLSMFMKSSQQDLDTGLRENKREELKILWLFLSPALQTPTSPFSGTNAA